jgi:hypothetical protein
VAVSWDTPPFEVWRLEPGDVIRVPGRWPEAVTVTETGYGGPAHDRVEWTAQVDGLGKMRGDWRLPRGLAVELLAAGNRNGIWVRPERTGDGAV